MRYYTLVDFVSVFYTVVQKTLAIFSNAVQC